MGDALFLRSTIQLGRFYRVIDVLNAPQCTTKESSAVTVVPQQRPSCGN